MVISALACFVQVTIYGQSSGGTSVWALMMSPLASGLFQRAWSISGSSVLNKTLADAKKENGEMFTGPNSTIAERCPNVTEECLKSME